MISIEKYIADKKNIWDEFIDNSKNGTFMLKRDYMDYHSDRFIDNSLMFYENDKLIAVMPASLHGDELRSHGGLTYGGIISDNSMKQHRMLECFAALISYLKEKHISTLIYKIIPHIYHKQPSEEDLYALFVNDAKLFRRDVASTVKLDDPIKMPKGRKAQISRAKREGVIIKQSFDFDKFIELENAVLSDRYATKAVHTGDELKLLHSRFVDNIQLWVAEYNEKIIAGTLLFVYDNIVHTQYMAADETAREIGGLDLLIKTLMDKFATDKAYFDFGISNENNGRYLNEGLISQKEGFGGRSIIYDFYKMEI